MRPGPFLWGPRGDRVVLDGLEVRGSAPRWRPARGIETRVAGLAGRQRNALAFVMPGGLNLASAALGSIDLRELTRSGAAPPTWRWPATCPGGAGLRAPARGRLEIWMASNAGSGAVRLVGPAGWARWPSRPAARPSLRGQAAGRQPPARGLLAGRAQRLAPAWTGERDVLAVVSRRDPAATQIAVDTGSGCDDRRADLSGLDGGPGRPLLPSASRPTGAVGWLNTRQVLVVEGGCDGPFDLWLVDVNGGEPKPVAHGIDRAALRWPDPAPPPRDWPRWAGSAAKPPAGRPPSRAAASWHHAGDRLDRQAYRMEWSGCGPAAAGRRAAGRAAGRGVGGRARLRVAGCDRDCDPGGVAVVLVLATTLPLVWRRRRPLAVSLTTGMATAAYGFAHYPDLAMPIAIGVVGMYSVAAWGGRRAALLAGGVAAVVVAVVMTLPGADADVVDAAFVSLSWPAPGCWATGPGCSGP